MMPQNMRLAELEVCYYFYVIGQELGGLANDGFVEISHRCTLKKSSMVYL